MRRCSTTEDKSHCSINYKLQAKKNSKKWINKRDQGEKVDLLEQKKLAPQLNRELSGDKAKMTASILSPISYNDNLNKFHSITAASNLAQSMKYATDAWLYYGNFSNSSSTQQSHFQNHFDPALVQNNFQPFHIVPHHGYVIAACSNCHKNNVLAGQQKSFVAPAYSSHNLKRVQVFGTVRSKNNAAVVNSYPVDKFVISENMLYSPLQPIDPSSIAKLDNNGPVTSSPINRKFTMIPANKSNKVNCDLKPLNNANNDKKQANEQLVANRKSILECSINPYDLIQDADDDIIIEKSNNLGRTETSKSPRKTKSSTSTISKTIKSRLLNIGSNTVGSGMKVRAKINSSSFKSHKKSSSSIGGVCIAGHKITMTDISKKSTTPWDEDWISDPCSQDDFEEESNPKEQIPVRPPRKNSIRISNSEAKDKSDRSRPVYDNNCNGVGKLKNLSSKNIENCEKVNCKNYDKSRLILEKPYGNSLPQESTNNKEVIADELRNSISKSTSNVITSSSPKTNVDSTFMQESLRVDGVENSSLHFSVNELKSRDNKPILLDSSKKSSDVTCKNEKYQKKRKVKKQVQFKEIKEEIINTRQFTSTLTPSNRDPNDENKPSTLCYTDYSSLGSQTTKSSTESLSKPIPALPRLPTTRQYPVLKEHEGVPTLEIRNLNNTAYTLNNNDKVFDTKISVPANQKEKISICVPSLNGKPSNHSRESINESRSLEFINYETKPVPNLHRTLSESISTFQPLAINPHFEEFKDTMRLRIRGKQSLNQQYNLNLTDHSVSSKSKNIDFSTNVTTLQLPSAKSLIEIGNYNNENNLPQLDQGKCDLVSDNKNLKSAANDKTNDSSRYEISGPHLDQKQLDIVSHINDTLSSAGPSSVIKIKIGLEAAEDVALSSEKEVTAEVIGRGNENRTIVTITPISHHIQNKLENRSIMSSSSNESINSSTVVSTDSNSTILYQNDNANNTVTINVGYHENSYSSSNEYYESSSVLMRSSFSDVTTSDTSEKYQSLDEDSNSISIVIPCNNSKFNSIPTNIDVHGLSNENHIKNVTDSSIHYMSCKINETLTEKDVGLNGTQIDLYNDTEPIYEEILDRPPPLPLEPPPDKVEDIGIIIPPRSIFEGASKYDILKYLAGAKERCQIPEEPHPRFVIEEIVDCDPVDSSVSADDSTSSTDLSSRISHLSNVSDSSDELVTFLMTTQMSSFEKTNKSAIEIERNDSGVGSETGCNVRVKWQHLQTRELEDQPLICEDCELSIETSITDSLSYAPLVCQKCSKKRIERREIITEIVETEEKYGRDLRIVLDEFYKPMMVAGLLTAEQLSSIFLNVEELIEHNALLAEKLRDGYDIAVENGDEDLLTFDVGKLFLDAAPMLHAFEFYCTRQGNAALLLSQLEKEKELLKIFLRVSQMENTVLRRMNLNSFLMVPVQRVTKYPLLLARLYKVTPEHQILRRERLKEARHNIELHLEHINSLTKDNGSMKIWRRISMMNSRRASGDVDDITNIKLQKLAVEILEWGHDEVRFAMEGRLLYAQPTDYHWKRTGRTVKLILTNALLVTLGKPTENYNPDFEDHMTFPQKNGIRETSLLLIREKAGKYSLVRDPLYLDQCIIYCDNNFQEYFEVQEIPSKDTYIFKAEDEEKTQKWYKLLQYHSQGLGSWRRRRNALANIMINGMQLRS